MKRFLIIVSAHLILFLLIIAYQVQASEDGWTIVEGNKDYIYLTKNGDVIYGDKLIFSMDYNDCDKLQHLFTFLTTKAPGS